MKVEVSCCAGNERYVDECLRDRCPVYKEAKSNIDRSWPYVGTGFGNLYGNPIHRQYLSEVRYEVSINTINQDEGGSRDG